MNIWTYIFGKDDLFNISFRNIVMNIYLTVHLLLIRKRTTSTNNTLCSCLQIAVYTFLFALSSIVCVAGLQMALSFWPETRLSRPSFGEIQALDI